MATDPAAMVEAAVRGAIGAGASSKQLGVVVAASVRTALLVCSGPKFFPGPVEREVSARLSMVEPALKQQVDAAAAGRVPTACGGARAARNFALHGDLGCGAAALPASAAEAKRRQRGGRRRPRRSQRSVEDSTSAPTAAERGPEGAPQLRRGEPPVDGAGAGTAEQGTCPPLQAVPLRGLGSGGGRSTAHGGCTDDGRQLSEDVADGGLWGDSGEHGKFYSAGAGGPVGGGPSAEESDQGTIEEPDTELDGMFPEGTSPKGLCGGGDAAGEVAGRIADMEFVISQGLVSAEAADMMRESVVELRAKLDGLT